MLSLLYIFNVIRYRKASKLSREDLLKVQQKQWLKLLKLFTARMEE